MQASFLFLVFAPCSRATFTQALRLKGHTRLTVNGYLTALRIEKAKELLKATDKSVAEVARLVGFNDYNYFIRVFKKTVGTTPLSYKKPDRRTE